MAWHPAGNKPLSDLIMAWLLTYMCIIQTQWIDSLRLSVTYIYAYINNVTTGSDNGLLTSWHHSLIKTNAHLMLMESWNKFQQNFDPDINISY